MKRHAYLIMAHNNFGILEQLLRCIDDERNSVFLHIDKKVKNFDFERLKNICCKAKLYYTPKRYNVKWGAKPS